MIVFVETKYVYYGNCTTPQICVKIPLCIEFLKNSIKSYFIYIICSKLSIMGSINDYNSTILLIYNVYLCIYYYCFIQKCILLLLFKNYWVQIIK